ncbi:FAD-dependent oxidoreductase [Bordetella petrii]|nr:FAD-dependent oxidoreductase [Bordetella petrii]
MNQKSSSGHEWRAQADVVVVGFGGAGAAAAITAADLGASVILLEKAPRGNEGGNTRVAAQGYLNPSSPDLAQTYLNALCGPYPVPADMARAWAEEMCKNNAWLEAIGGDPQEHQLPPEGVEFPELPGAACVHKYHHGDILGYSKTWEALARAVAGRDIEIWYESPARHLIQAGETGAILGVRAERDGRMFNVQARKAVILTCGGFENNQEMIRNFLPNLPFCYTSGTPYNEGDGVRMGMEVGADLWHMNNFAGPTMALKVPEYPTTFSLVPLHFSHEPRGGMVVVGPDGKRFADEKYKNRHGKVFDGGNWVAPRMPLPMYMVFDHALFRAGPLHNGTPTHGWTQIMCGYAWSADNERELNKGWIKSAPTLAALAGLLGLPEGSLARTVARWNELCAGGQDVDLGRKKMLTPFSDGPYYAVELSPSMLNTQGGPRRNARAQVVRPGGEPIPRLYSAGELGSIYSYLYQGTGNIGECFAFGRIAARNAVAENSWI